jgi:flagellar basal-body rod protein FlgG
MEAQQQRLDALANDIANVNTTGYKSLRVGFRDLLYQQVGRGTAAGVITGGGAAAGPIGRSDAQGALLATERPLDVALGGPGYIRVRDADGRIALTRDGSLAVDAGGRLRTSAGQLLEPPVQLPRGVDPGEVRIAPDGTVSAEGRRFGRISVVTVPNPDGLAAAGNSLYLPTEASGALAAAPGTRIEQGVLEGSNVDLAEAMVEMTNAQRGFALASRAVQTQDEVLGVANGVKR